MQMISGTIKSAVKLDALMGKWEEKKVNNDWRKDSTLTGEQKMICQFQEDLANMREGNKTEEIASKVYGGQRLTTEELEYLQKECPELYRDYVEIRNERESYERKLKKCETKEEVDRLKTDQMSQYAATAKKTFNNPNIPLGEKYRIARKLLAKITGVIEVEAEFKASKQYKDLESEHDIRRRESAKTEASEELAKEVGEVEGAESPEEAETHDAKSVASLVADLWNAQRPVGGGAAYIDSGEVLGEIEKKENNA